MAVAILPENYDGEFFKQLPHLHYATDTFLKRKVKDYINHLEPVFMKHFMTKKYGLILVHRHFEVQENEILVETLKGDHSVSVSIPWTLRDGKASPSISEADLLDAHGITVSSSKFPYVVPQTWTFSETGELKAYEFLASSTPMEQPPPEFVADLFQELQRLGLESILGLRLVENLIDRTSRETIPKDGRVNVLTFGPFKVDESRMFQVVFMFNKDGQGYCCCDGGDHSWMQCYTDFC